ncbi:MAG TPA: YIP1 family protein [Candidatus Acidoferrales bacterium]|nr:YIP1 family protein [Candidatus Acidoferrales bacterium]
MIFAPIFVLLMTLVYWGAFNLFTGTALAFKSAFGIVSYAFVPLIISGLLAIIILLIKPRGDADPEHFLASSLAAFLPDDAPKWLAALGQSLELFWISTMSLVAIGFSAANRKKIKPAGAFLTVFGMWAVWVLGKVAWAMF